MVLLYSTIVIGKNQIWERFREGVSSDAEVQMSAVDSDLADMKEQARVLDLLLEVAQGKKTSADVQKWLEENYPGLKNLSPEEKALLVRKG